MSDLYVLIVSECMNTRFEEHGYDTHDGEEDEIRAVIASGTQEELQAKVRAWKTIQETIDPPHSRIFVYQKTEEGLSVCSPRIVKVGK